MFEYVIVILLLAAIITTVAVSAGAVVYIRATHGTSSLTFQLSRIGILWGAAILILILVGALGACVTGWTINSVSDIFAWLMEHNPIGKPKELLFKFLDWGYEENPWGAWALVLFMLAALLISFARRHLCTPAVAAVPTVVCLMLSAYIWRGAWGWFLVQVIAAIYVLVILTADGTFDDQYTWRQRREILRKLREEAERKAAAEAIQFDQPDDPDDPTNPVPDHHRPVEVIGSMVADCFRTLSEQ